MIYEKTLKKSIVDQKINEKEAEELKNIYNHCVNKRMENMSSTKLEVEDIFGDVFSKNSVSPEQITQI